jgi:hypothetical protein
MPSSFPSSVPSAVGAPPSSPAVEPTNYPDPNDGGKTHSQKHKDISDTIVAIATKVGANASSDPTSQDAKLTRLMGLYRTVGLTYAQFGYDQVFLPSNSSGGALGLGTYNLPFSIGLSLPALVVEYRVRDAVSTGNPTIVDWTPIAYAVPAATSQTVTAIGAPVTNAWVFFDLRANQDNAQIVLGANQCSIGAVPSARPVITGINPTTGYTTGNTTVTITGQYFLWASAVKFAANNATSFSVVSATQITAVSPVGSAGVADITLTTPNGTSATGSADRFTYIYPPPSITQVMPYGGPLGGNNVVTITGTYFYNVTAVKFGGVNAVSYTVNSPTQITATVPAASAGTVDVAVTTSSGTSPTVTQDHYQYLTAPAVTGISPATGYTSGGTQVVITGTNLSNATAVSFGTTAAAAFTVNSATQITATSPVVSSAGAVDVTVTTLGGTSPATSADQFTYSIAPPTVTGIAPPGGPTSGGTTVTITGTNLNNVTAVKFGTTNATSFALVSATRMTAVSPAESSGVVDITVTNGGGTSGTSSADRFTYAPLPVVTSVSPTTGAAGTTVTISGSGFTNATVVRFGLISATSFTVVSDGSVTATAPIQSPGNVDVTVTTAGGTSAVGNNDQFVYGVSGPVYVQGKSATNPTGISQSLTVTLAQSQTAGNLNVVAVNLYSGSSSTVASVADSAGNTYALASGPDTGGNATSWLYYCANIKTASGSNQVTVTFGTGGGPYPEIWVAEYAGVSTISALDTTGTGTGHNQSPSASITTATANELVVAAWYFEAAVLSGSPGDGFTNRNIDTTGNYVLEDIVASSAGALTHADNINNWTGWVGHLAAFMPAAIVSGPVVTAVQPSSGYVGGGTTVVIYGHNLGGANAVSFGSNAAVSFTQNSPSQITAVSPSSGSLGIVDVTVTTGSGTSGTTASDHFTYTAAPPTVTGVSPSSGPVAGGYTVTVTGTNLTGATAVTFGSTPATSFTVNGITQITATVPAGTLGVVDVTVTTAGGGTSGTSTADQFTYAPPSPVISQVAPNRGNDAGGGLVELIGSNFTSASAVHFGAVAAAQFSITNDGQIMVTAPAGSDGTIHITVTTPNGTSQTSSADQYTYSAGYSDPTLTADGNQPTVQAAIDAAANGGTVTIPNGQWTWTTKVTISKPLKLQGQSPTGCVILNNITTAYMGAVEVAKSTAGPIEVANLYFVAVGGVSGSPQLFHLIVTDPNPGQGREVLVHDNTFISRGDGSGVLYSVKWSSNGGVIWRNHFHTGGAWICGLEFYSDESDWKKVSTFGTLDTTGLNNTYIEDNDFHGGWTACTNFDDNSRVVFRHNTCYDSVVTDHGEETSPYGARQQEIYNNTFHYTASGTAPPQDGSLSYPLNEQNWVFLRGGTALIYNNVMDTIPYKGYVSLAVFSITRAGQIPPPTYAGNGHSPNWPAARQVGQGWSGATGSYGYTYYDQSGNPYSPLIFNVEAIGSGYILDPIYVWNNTNPQGQDLHALYGDYVGHDPYPDEVGSGQNIDDYVQLNRDYYHATKPGYTAYAYPHPLRNGN